MKSTMYDTLVEAIGDYIGKGIELGKNASHFSHNGCYIFRLWSEDEKFVWVIIAYPLASADNRFHAFFNLYKSEDAPEIMQTTIKSDGAIDKSDILIVIESDGTWKFFE